MIDVTFGEVIGVFLGVGTLLIGLGAPIAWVIRQLSTLQTTVAFILQTLEHDSKDNRRRLDDHDNQLRTHSHRLTKLETECKDEGDQ